MIKYIPGGIESALNDMSNMALINEINDALFSSCIIFADHDIRLQEAKYKLIEAGENYIAEHLDYYFYSEA
jgi:phosphoribosyl-ATP pyrophosphohydrolase